MTPRITPRGPVSEALLEALRSDPSAASASGQVHRFAHRAADALLAQPDLLTDEDLQLTLFVLYGLHYGETVDAVDEWEWNPDLLRTRRSIEREFERQLRELRRRFGTDVASRAAEGNIAHESRTHRSASEATT